MKKVFITGANGFIGQSMARYLNANGIETCGIDFVEDPNRQIFHADLFAVDSWRELMLSCDTVIHTAAIVSNAATEEDTWRVNVLGTQVVLDEAAKSANKMRFLHFSSVAALGLSHTGEMDENTALRACGQKYSDSKLASEHLVLNYNNAGKVDATIIRPADVYGPGSKPWIVTPISMMKQKKFIVPKEGMFGPVYIDDLIEGCYLALCSQQAIGQIYILSGMGQVSNEAYFSYLAKMLGQTAAKTLSKQVIYPIAFAAERLAHLFGKQTELNPSTVAMLSRPSAQYSHAKASKELAYQPKVSLEEGMARSEVWLREQGML